MSKMNNPSLTITRLRREYGPYATSVLEHAGLIKPVEGRKKGTIRRFEILGCLPTPAGFNKLFNKRYGTTVGDLIEDAYAEFEDLKNELEEWAYNVEEHFPDKADEVGEAADALEVLESPDVEDDVSKLEVVYAPPIRKKKWGRVSVSRAARCDEACSRLGVALDVLESFEGELKMRANPDLKKKIIEVQELAHKLESHISDAENIDFPGMY